MISSYLVVYKQFVVKLVIFSMVISLAACGGDDDKPRPTPTPTPTPDTTPADFSLSLPQSTYAPGAVATTAEVTITDIDELVNISITTGGEYAVDGGSFTSSAGQIAENQTLVARATAGANFDDEVMVSVTVGTVTESFTVVTEAQDTTPEAFSFTAVTDAALSSEFVSGAVTITGINDATPVSITGGEYSIDAGTYTNSAGTVTNGQSITVQLMSSDAFSTQSTATLNVGGVEAGFSVTTLAQDITPDAFSFTAVTDADFNTQYTSNVVTISGINDAAPVTISGGEYAIDAGTYTSDSGTVVNGDTVSVRLTSAAAGATVEMATLSVGGVEGAFSVTTAADTTLPVVELYFPTQLGLTDKPTLRVRGVASDDLSGVASVTVNGVDVETSDDYATWQATIDLALGENEISLIAQDGSGNTTPSQVFATITRSDDLTGSYNVVDETMERFYGLQFLPETEQLYFVEDRRNHYFMNPVTGAVTLASAAPDPVEHNEPENGRTFVTDYYSINGIPGIYAGGRPTLYHVNLETGARTFVTDATIPDASFEFNRTSGIDVYEGDSVAESYMFVTDLLNLQLMKVNLQTGEKQVFSDNSDTSLGVAIEGITVQSVHISSSKDMVYVTTDSGIYSIDINDESRILLATNDFPNDIHIPAGGNSLLAGSGELCGNAIDNGELFVSCIDVSEGGDFSKRVLSDSIPSGTIGFFQSSANWENRDLLYTSYDNAIAVTDVLTGEHVVLMKIMD